LLPGLVDGDTSTLDPQLRQAFKTAGLTHLIAVSGTNAAVLIAAVLLVLRRLRTPPWACAVIGGLVLVAFVAVARPSPSVVRAGVMAGVLLVSLATGRPRQGLPSLALAVLVLLMWHPDWAGNAGFAMSALATGSLFLIAPGWADALRRRHVPPILAEGLAVSGAATMVSAPIIVLLSGRVSLVALPANILAELAVAPATILGVLAAATAPWSPFLGAAFARAAGVPCRWLVADARWFSSLPGATLAWPDTAVGAIGLVLVIVAAAALLRFPATRRPLVAAVLTVIAIEVPGRAVFGGWAPSSTILVACDVGQGDAIVLPIGHHAAVVMDSGPEPMAIDRCLHSLGVTKVPLYIQSHFDLDHVAGVGGLADGRRIGAVVTGPLQAPPLGRGILTRTLSPLGITSRIVAAGTDIDEGPLHLQVLESHVVDVDGVPDSNNSSLMIRATIAGHSILLTGDASTQAQQALIASGQNFAADVLKVPHHGSAYFDPAFLAAVHAKLAVISVGSHNTYGHPAPSLLHALADLHVPVRRTDQDGDVAILARGSQLQVVRHEPSARLSATSGAGEPRPVRPAGLVDRRAVAGVESSGGRATMVRWRPIHPAGLRPTGPRPTGPGSSWSSVTRSSWSTGPSSRSPPPGAAWIPTQRWSNASGPTSFLASCSSC
jgi:competence protein ComEC